MLLTRALPALLFGLWFLAPACAGATDWHSFLGEKPRDGVFEPSGVGQLPDGRLFLVQDEPEAALGTLTLSEDGPARGIVRVSVARGLPPLPRLDDLEGLATDPSGAIFAITSFSRTRSGNHRKSRQRLVRLRIEGDTIREAAVYDDLLEDILTAFPELLKSAKSIYAKGRLGFNIEGLCFDQNGDRLLIGLRGPVINGDTVILSLNNAKAVFQGDKPRFSPEMIRLDLNKQGIRAMTYAPALGWFLLVTQKAHKKGASNADFHLWAWNGETGSAAKMQHIPDLTLRKTEGISQIRHKGRDYLFLVSDDGARNQRRPAHYLMLPTETIGSQLEGP